jgi:integrase
MSRRRGSGDGSIFKDGNRWVACVTVMTTQGRQVRRKRIARTYSEARAKLRELQDELQAGVNPGRLTVATYLDRWLKRQEASDKSPSTVANYRWAIDTHLKPTLGHITLPKLTPDNIDVFLATMAESGAAKNTMMRVRAVLSMALDDAVARRVVTWNPVTATRTPAGPKRESRSLTLEQARALLDKIRGDRLEAMWLTMLLVGLRPGEAAGLRWDDLELKTGFLHVRRARLDEPGGIRLGDPKTRRSTRTIELPAPVQEALRRHRVRQAEERLAAGATWHDNGMVFCTTVGTPIDRWALRRHFTKLTEQAGLGQWHPTELRHSTVSLLSDAGVRLEEVADLAGHSTTRMTGDVYRHVVRQAVGGGAKAVMEQMFGRGSNEL